MAAANTALEDSDRRTAHRTPKYTRQSHGLFLHTTEPRLPIALARSRLWLHAYWAITLSIPNAGGVANLRNAPPYSPAFRKLKPTVIG